MIFGCKWMSLWECPTLKKIDFFHGNEKKKTNWMQAICNSAFDNIGELISDWAETIS